MKVVTWNVNSLRARAERVAAFLQRQQPDVVCLQELKAEEKDLPVQLFADAGYALHALGQKTYNGVAIASRLPVEDVRRGLDDGVEDPQARLISGRVSGVRIISVYVPNGSEVGSDKYAYKQAWLKRLGAYLARHHAADEPLVLCGDFNVAPDERDVHDPAEWVTTTLFTPEIRAALNDVLAFGLLDSLRVKTQDAGIYTWWDYRMLGFPKNRGLRIDHLFVTRPLVPRCRRVVVDREERKGKNASDHAPVILELTYP